MNSHPVKIVPHRKFLRWFRSRYRDALNELWGDYGGVCKKKEKNIAQASKRGNRAGSVGLAPKPATRGVDVGQQSLEASAMTKAVRSNIHGKPDDNSDTDDFYGEIPQGTPPPNIVDLLEQETTLCDSPKDRGVFSDAPPYTERLPFGYFQCGQTLYRNKLNDQELLEDGFVALHQLVVPNCQSALLTTFDSHVTMKSSIHLAMEVCPDVPKVLLVGHADYMGMPFCGLRLPYKHKAIASLKVKREWYWMACRPFGRPEQLMHAKILLFRSDQGLRIAVSGNNLTEKQWTEDRDCLWIQDVPASVAAQREHSSSTQVDELPMIRLKCFLVDLLKSSVAFHDIDSHMDELILSFVMSKVETLLGGLEDHAVNSKNVRFVYSFPRPMKQGGWQQLCQAVWELRQVEKKKRELYLSNHVNQDDLWYDTDDGDGDNIDFGARTLNRIYLFAMSGSFGDLKPDFLHQMRKAMAGYRSAIGYCSTEEGNCGRSARSSLSLGKSLSWSAIKQTFCLWPSNETVLSMNPIALLGRCRPMSRAHWETIPASARRSLFFDAVPNPRGPSLQSSTESQAAAGFGRNLTPSLCGLRFRSEPLSAYHSFAHGKVIFATTMCNAGKEGRLPMSESDRTNIDAPYAAVYVGSHNFSKNAWGIRDSRPGNIEFGVVLLTTDRKLTAQWRSRLPYELPDPNSSSRGCYRPGHWWDIFHRDTPTLLGSNTDENSSVETI
jgi:Tyrosyl-DNA phosphodiesterase